MEPGSPTVALPARRSAAPGRVLGRYVLERRLGSGGFGTVWQARDERLERRVAVKVVPQERVAGERGWREALAVARLSHPAIVALYEAGADDEAAYLVSELVRGETLAALLARGALSDRDVGEVGLALAAGLAHAHAHGVVHRDVKPANVIVPEALRPGAAAAKLTDFGVAHVAGGDLLTRTGDVVGTLAYMAPEQAEGRRVTPAVDLYALALVLYEAWSGGNPVRAASPAATARRVGARLPSLARRRPDLPRALCAALDRALDPDPPRRGTLADLRRVLDACRPRLDDEPPEEERTPPGAARRGARMPSVPRPPARIAAAVAAGVLVAAVAPGPNGGFSLAAALAVLLLPRLGWLAATAAGVAWLAAVDGRPGAALVLAAALAPVPFALPRRGVLWSLPAAAPALGAVGLPVLDLAGVGQVRGPVRRALLGALGGWWLLLAEALLGRRLLAGAPPEARVTGRWTGSVSQAVHRVIEPVAHSGGLGVAVAWAAGAVVLPWLVRGRSLTADLAAGAVWATALAGATATLAPGADPALTALGAALAALVATAVRAARRPAVRVEVAPEVP